jgi:hypothetical protein
MAFALAELVAQISRSPDHGVGYGRDNDLGRKLHGELASVSLHTAFKIRRPAGVPELLGSSEGMHSTLQRPAAFDTTCRSDWKLALRCVYVAHIRESLR